MLFYFVALLLPLTEAVPSGVTGLMISVVSGQAAITVSWDKPSSDQTIISYEVEYGEFGVGWIDIVTVQGADSLTTVITNLIRGTHYVVRVRALSAAGNGPYSAPPRPGLILPSLPSPVTGVMLSVVPGEAAIAVTWTKPSSDQPIIRYEAEYGINFYTESSTIVSVQGADTLTVTITGLQRGARYVVHVRAVSNTGNGPYNAFPDQRITIPNVPPQVSVVSGQAAIRVTWTKSSIGGTVIGYDVQYKTSYQSWDGISTTRVTGENIVTVDLTNVQRGTTYNVRVRAVSNAGNGPYSQEATSTVPRLPPQVSGVSLSVVSGQATIRVTWTKPSVEGTFFGYDVQHKTSSQGWSGISTTPVAGEDVVTIDLPSLQRGTTYNVRIRAVSIAANGPYSAEATYTLPGFPSAVTGVMLSVVSGQAAIRVNWNKPSVEGTFIRYNVQYRTSSQSWDASTTETVVDQNVVTVNLTNLQRGTTYNIRVRAVSNTGNGPYSTAATSILQTIVPLEVTGVSLSVVAVEVSWKKRSVVGNFIRYEVKYKISSQSWNTSTTETVVDENVVTVDLTNLQRGTTYNVRVRAVSDGGNGPYSTDTTFTVPNVDEEAAFEIFTSPLDSHVGVIVGVFVAGLVAGVFGLLLVLGIVFGACKLYMTKQPNKTGSKYTERSSDPNAVEMTQSPAYESVGKAYEDVDHPTQQRGVPKKINEEYAIIE